MPALTDPTVVPEGAEDAATEPTTNGLTSGNGRAEAPSELGERTRADAIGLDELEDLGQLGAEADADTEAPPIGAVPAVIPPSLLRRRLVRGRYVSAGIPWQLELRVDVGGSRPLNRVSGDFFSTSGATTTYFGSFVVDGASITRTPSRVTIEGMGTYTWSAGAPFVRVTIPRKKLSQPPAAATIQFITPPNTPGARYLCPFASGYFRTVQWEQDSVAGAVPFISYDTGQQPQPAGSPARVLSVSSAYAEAGIELLAAGAPNVIPGSFAGATWSDSELHNAMVNHFSLFADLPQWRVWLLVASAHDEGYRGIMFDASDSFQRQGCAVFYDAIQGADPASQRAALRTYVHELGHAFNLLHSWQKDLADPPAPLGANQGFADLSWMNYPQNYLPQGGGAGGTAAYWADFPFQFTDDELRHLRHGFYRNVIMGASAFGTGAAEIDPDVFAEPIVDNSGLALELRGRETFAYGEPVVVELKLNTTDLRGRTTHGYLHPSDDLVSIAIRQPSGRIVLYQPLLRHCVDEDRQVRLDANGEALYESAYIGFGRDGFYFEQPGRYELRARYVGADGSRVVSPVMSLRVRTPRSEEDERAGELLMGDEQGQLLALLGSDSERLRDGRDALETLIEEQPDHPLTVYAQLAKGYNCAREFKDILPDRRVETRPPQPKEADQHLSAVEEASRGDAGVDNITLNLAMRSHARAEAEAGGPEQADRVLDRMIEIFTAKDLAPAVLRTIKRQAEETKAEISAEVDERAAAKGS